MTGSAPSNTAVLFHSPSSRPHCPRQVLFPPDTRTIHVSRPSRSGEAGDGDGDSTDCQLSLVKGVMLAAAAAAAEAGSVATGDGTVDEAGGVSSTAEGMYGFAADGR